MSLRHPCNSRPAIGSPHDCAAGAARQPLISGARKARSLALGLALALAVPAVVAAMPVATAFTYQGELRSGGLPANASFDMEFRLYDADAGGSQIGPVVSRSGVPAVEGLFSVQLDFGPAQFAGDRQWLEVRIKPAGAGSFETLSPRSEVTAAPYALGAVAALANSVTTTSIVDGTITAVDIDPAQIQRRVTGTCPVGQFLRVVNPDGTVSCAADADAGGTVTSIATGAGLTGGPITGSGTISVAPGGIGAVQIDAAQVQRRVGASCPDGQFLRAVNEDGTVACSVDAIGPPGWSLSGNAGTDASTDFIGTTDAQPFVVRTQNVPSLRIEPSSLLVEGVPITTNTIAGSSANGVIGEVRGATIGGGGVPAEDSDPSILSGAPNQVTGNYGTVAGGVGNRAGASAAVGGGQNNVASGRASAIGGGELNGASAVYSTVSGGLSNMTSGSYSTVGGGGANIASGFYSSVSGGVNNLASGEASVVGGGYIEASGAAATVSGGIDNCAGGYSSWAGGVGAKVRPGVDPGGSGACSGLTYSGDVDFGDAGSFVWADAQGPDFVSTGPNQFLVRALGGVVFTGSSGVRAPVGNMLRVVGTVRVDVLGAAGSTALCRNANNQLASCSSSARYKRDIGELELGLAEVLRLHAVDYHWKESGEADIGFIAEEVAAIDARLVNYNETGQVEGVKYDRLSAVLANAVQELAAWDSLTADRLTRIEHDNAALRAENERLRDRMARLEARLDALVGTER